MKKALALAMAALLCVSACAETLEIGDKGGQVLKVQESLYEKGYLDEEADGMYGEMTAKAVSAFQKDNGLEPTGTVDEETKALIISGGAGEVRKVQQKLAELGYLNAEADGVMGAATSGALGVFQRDNGLEVTGELDDATRELLLSETEQLKSEATLVQEKLIELGYLQGKADGDFGPMSEEALYLFQEANDLPATGEIDEKTKNALFSDAAKGDAVRRAQGRLIELGYLSGSADGIFGAKSEAAIEKFQKVHGLEVTGQPDDATMEKLLSDDAMKIRSRLTYDDVSDAVKELQLRLISLGFLNTGADGHFGENTQTAVRLFQEHLARQGEAQKLGIEADGVATSETQQLMFSKDYSSYLNDVALGYEGFEALRVERQLRNLGYMDASPNEHFDAYAAECVKAVQADAGLTATGVADKATMDVLFAPDAALAKRYVLHAVALGDEGHVVGMVQSALIRMGMLAGQPTEVYGEEVEAAVERLYKYLAKYNSEHAQLFEAQGMVSASAQEAMLDRDLVVYVEDVNDDASASETERVQRRLNNLLYLNADGIDGDYGESTKAAIEHFQEENDLPVTGVADEETQRVMFSDSAMGNWMPYKLEVDIANQRVYAYELNDEGKYVKIHDFICSTGLGNLTPTGTFTETTEPLDRWHYFYNFNCWAQYAWRITGPFYFHSVIYSQKDEDTLRMSSIYNLGSKASHGCVRLEVEAAKWIYENCEAGTTVVIH